jgi:hypothetical protein
LGANRWADCHPPPPPVMYLLGLFMEEKVISKLLIKIRLIDDVMVPISLLFFRDINAGSQLFERSGGGNCEAISDGA